MPDPKRLIRNVESEADKFQETINLLRQQRLILLRAITEGDPLFIGKDASKASIGKIRELNKILSLVRADKRDNLMTFENAMTATDDIVDD